ncbi:MAG TPA: DNA topoisomerase VI subunit B [Methanomassiliicoccales archaeon]|nr:DNA topoisomerase VI subunit B [Methanomassiliicoccales archaeon]
MTSIADHLAKKQKEISVSEFFERNRQILGFDSATKALIMAVKEAMDNSLDACEEAGFLPDIIVKLAKVDEKEFHLTVEDNGPGIVPEMIPNVFGRLLFGSRFHAIRQSRGQQGIGISATVMYGQITTGKPAKITSKTEKEKPAAVKEVMLNTKTNSPLVVGPKAPDDYIMWDEKEHGTRVEINLNGRYVGGKQSVLEYLKQTAIVNPHASITFVDPEGKTYLFARAYDQLPPSTKEIKPHPEGVELGTLMNLGRASRTRNLKDFLKTDFCRISDRVANDIIERSGLTEKAKTPGLSLEQYKALLGAMQSVKYLAPSTECLSPIGEALIRKGLKNVLDEAKPEFYTPPVTRAPRVYSGNPFQIEVGIVYGGNIPADQPVTILRFANRVPLLYQQGGCALTKAVENVDWRRYGLEQRGGSGIPFGPAIILVHIASTKVPFTSEAKEAVANLPEIQAELELALRESGRRLKVHLNKKETKSKTKAKFEIVQEILPLIAQKSAKIVNRPVPELGGSITKIMNVVWIDDSVTYEKKKHVAKVNIYNYTPRMVRFNLHAIVPAGSLDLDATDPKPVEVKEDGKVTWELRPIHSTDKQVVTIVLAGLDPDLYDENELYSSGIDPTMIIGADPLPGDWDVAGLKITEVPAEVPNLPAEEEEEEIDYDESSEALSDD